VAIHATEKRRNNIMPETDDLGIKNTRHVMKCLFSEVCLSKVVTVTADSPSGIGCLLRTLE
jgi:hypothetical protein